MARRFIVRNIRKRKFIFTVLFLTLFMIGVGYSTLSTKLNIGGSLGVSKAKCQTNSKLYNVLKCAVEDGLALEYTGAHQDSMDASKSTEKIYHWYAPEGTEGDNLANQILEKNNVIFANHCWQMIRTTDTGGVKMIYNGEAENNQCLNTRGYHVGYSSRTIQNLASNYWYGTDYTYDSTNGVFSIAGTTEQTTWNETTGPNLIGKYTCLGTTVDATCYTLYLVDSYMDSSTATLIQLVTYSNYSQFGALSYDSKSVYLGDVSLAFAGYMYGDNYMYDTTYVKRGNSAIVESILFPTTSVGKYTWYADSINYTSTSSEYSLVNPYQVSSTDDYSNLVGKYTFFRDNKTFTYFQVYYIVAVNGSTVYYKVLRDGDISDNKSIVFGDSILDNGNGTYTIINNTTNVTSLGWYTNYANYKYKYTCNDSSRTCTTPRYITDTTQKGYTYNNVTEKIMIGKSRSGLTLTDTLLVRIDELLKNSSNYSEYKYTCNTDSAICTEETLAMILQINDTGYSYVTNHYYGSSVTWDGTNYTLQDVDELEAAIDLNRLSTHHYMCISNGLKTCSQVAYIYYIREDNGLIYYQTLKNGVPDIAKLMENMLTKNTTDSSIKHGVDKWYKHYLLEEYDNYIEDTIFCNDRSIQSLGGWNANGGMTNEELHFKEYNVTSNLSCSNETDKFSVSNNNAKLTYKVGLMSSPEMNILGNDNIRKTNSIYWLGSPRGYNNVWADINAISRTGTLTYSSYNTILGLRPAISLTPGIEYSDGDGSMANPFVVKMN